MSAQKLQKIVEQTLEQYAHILGQHTPKEFSLNKAIEHIVSYFESIIGCMPGNVYWLDQNCVAVGCNKNVLKMFGLKTSQEFKGLSFKDMQKKGAWAPKAAISFKKDSLEVLKTGKPKLNIEEPPIPNQDGNLTYFLTSRVPLFDHRKSVIGVVGISIDITDRKTLEKKLLDAKEKAEAANHAKTEFIANISHDIRTPLAGMLGLTNLLAEEAPNEEYKTNAVYLESCTQQLLNLLNSVLDVVSAENNRDEDVHAEAFHLHESIDHLKNLFLPAIRQKHLGLDIKIASEVPTYINTDRIKIERIILNLIGNAIKFTEKGKISLHVNWTPKKSDEKLPSLKIVVKDTGIGIPAPEQEKVFDRFFRVNPSYEGVYKGHGVGLYIVKKFTDILKGKITFKSTFGKGTTFTCVIPVKAATRRQAHVEHTELEPSEYETASVQTHLINPQTKIKKSSTNKTAHTEAASVLVVEDDELVFTMEKQLLLSQNCTIDRAKTGKAALQKLKKNTYDFVFMDIGLPDCSGIEVTAAVRQLEKTSQEHLPIVGLTAHTTQKIKQHCLAAGMDAVFTKPLQPKMIKQALEQFVSTDPLTRHTKKVHTEGKLGEDLPDTEAQLFKLDHLLVLDHDIALQCTGNKDIVKTLVTMLVKDSLPEERNALVKAHKTKNWSQIHELAHKIKGACLYCGATKLHLATQYMERYWKAGYQNTKTLEKLYQQLLDVIDETKDVAKKYLAKKGHKKHP